MLVMELRAAASTPERGCQAEHTPLGYFRVGETGRWKEMPRKGVGGPLGSEVI